jgi:hypothetical protein
VKTSSRFCFLLAATLLLPVGIAAHARPAAACLNEVVHDTNTKVQEMTLAEQALGAGKITGAAEAALRNYPKLHAAPRLMQGAFPNTGLDPVAVRAQRIVAVALVRTEGLLTIKGDFQPTTADERRANLEWSITILRAIVALKKVPAVQTDLGEALSKLSETRAEALSVLADLDKKDLVTSPQGYAALADLRQASGDIAGRDAALKRLAGMTKTRGPKG